MDGCSRYNLSDEFQTILIEKSILICKALKITSVRVYSVAFFLGGAHQNTVQSLNIIELNQGHLALLHKEGSGSLYTNRMEDALQQQYYGCESSMSIRNNQIRDNSMVSDQTVLIQNGKSLKGRVKKRKIRDRCENEMIQ